MNELIKIKIHYKNLHEIEFYFVNNNIKFKYLCSNKSYHYFNVYKKDYKRIKRKYKIKIVGYYGKENIKKSIKKHSLFIGSIFVGLTVLYFLSNTIFSVDINTNNKELKDMLYNELLKYKIKKYGRIKSYDEINNIKKEILKNNQDKLEWLEIKRDGTKYTVMLTERVIRNNNETDTSFRHIVSSKDALIKHISSSSGVVVKDVNDYVKKGEIIISGDLYKNDKYIKSMKAEGTVFGEVWYTVKTTIPYEYTEYVKLNKVINHYYIEFFGMKMTLIGKYETNNSMNENKLLIDKPYLGFKLYKEVKEMYEYRTFTVSRKDAYNEALRRSDKIVSNKLKDGEYIISKKVLNISPMSSKIEVVVFYKVYENITDILKIEEKKEYEE